MRLLPRLRRSQPAPAPASTGGEVEQKSFRLPDLLRRVTGSAPVWRNWSTEHAYREGMTRNTWLYDAVEIRRKSVASVPWHVERRNAEGEWERVPDHPLQALLDEPNPEFTQRQMIGRLVQWLDLGGNGYWLKVRAGRRNVPAELWPVMPDGMRALAGTGQGGDLIAGYRFESNGVTATMDAADVIHLTYPNPGSFYYGMGPLQAAGMAVDIDTEAQSFQKVSLQNRGIPDGVFTLDGQEVSREEYEQARQQVREQYQGREAHRAPWVVAQAKWQQMSLTPAEVDYIGTRKESRVEILSALGVPPPMVGVYDDATLANIETARRIFWMDTIVPLLEEVRDMLNAALVPEFARVGDLRIVYDTSQVAALRENFTEKVEAAERLWNMGVPLNMINQRMQLGIEDVPGGDTGYIAASKIPATAATAGGESGDGEGASDGDETGPQQLSESQVQTILTMIEQVARGELPRDSAVQLIAGSFPVSEEDAEAMVGEAGDGFTIESDDEQRADVREHARKRMRARGVGTTKDLARLAYGVD